MRICVMGGEALPIIGTDPAITEISKAKPWEARHSQGFLSFQNVFPITTLSSWPLLSLVDVLLTLSFSLLPAF